MRHNWRSCVSRGQIWCLYIEVIASQQVEVLWLGLQSGPIKTGPPQYHPALYVSYRVDWIILPLHVTDTSRRKVIDT